MSLLSRIPWPSHPGASCDTRERNSAMMAIGGCFLLALGVVIAAMMLVPSGGDPNDDTAGTLGGGYGTGSGDGFGAGTGSGSALAGDGPGAGKQGDRRGASGTATDSAPRGQRSGTVATANAKDGESLVTGDSKEVPKFSFKIPAANDTVDPPQTATAVGKKNGNDGEGRAGAGGGGGTTFMGVRTDAKHIVYLLDFSGSMDDAPQRPARLKAELNRSIQDLPTDAQFTVVLFGQSKQQGARQIFRDDNTDYSSNFVSMPPVGQLVPASERNKAAACSWVANRQVDIEANSNAAPAMTEVLRMHPQVVFLLTDGAFNGPDFRELQAVIEQGDPQHAVQINAVAFTFTDAAGGSDIQDLQILAENSGGTYRRVTIGR
jgi:hypothetical protein